MFTLKNLLRVHSTLNIKSRGRKEVRKTEDRIWAGTSNAGLGGSDPRSGSGATGISKSELKIQELVVGAWRFELQTSCAQGSCKKSILLARLALFCVMVHGFGPSLAVFGPKLDPIFSRLGRRQAGAVAEFILILQAPLYTRHTAFAGPLAHNPRQELCTLDRPHR